MYYGTVLINVFIVVKELLKSVDVSGDLWCQTILYEACEVVETTGRYF